MGERTIVVPQRREAVAKFLVEDGADTILKNSSGHTAMQVAQMANKNGSHLEVIRTIACATTKAPTPIARTPSSAVPPQQENGRFSGVFAHLKGSTKSWRGRK